MRGLVATGAERTLLKPAPIKVTYELGRSKGPIDACAADAERLRNLRHRARLKPRRRPKPALALRELSEVEK